MVSQYEMGGDVDTVIAACRAHGLSVTPQRLAIFRCLAASSLHPSAEVVHAELRQKMPTISLATVYKTLETLTAVGAIRPLTYMRGRMRYDANLMPHHHLVCTRCQAVEDVRDKRLDAVGVPARAAAAHHGFNVIGHAVEVWGLCRGCAESEGVVEPGDRGSDLVRIHRGGDKKPRRHST